MPNCVQLIKNGQEEPATFQEIDEELCRHFDEPCDPERYLHGWYDYIAFFLAMGKSFDEIDAMLIDNIRTAPSEVEWALAMRDINSFLKERYTAKSWYQRGRVVE